MANEDKELKKENKELKKQLEISDKEKKKVLGQLGIELAENDDFENVVLNRIKELTTAAESLEQQELELQNKASEISAANEKMQGQVLIIDDQKSKLDKVLTLLDVNLAEEQDFDEVVSREIGALLTAVESLEEKEQSEDEVPAEIAGKVTQLEADKRQLETANEELRSKLAEKEKEAERFKKLHEEAQTEKQEAFEAKMRTVTQGAEKLRVIARIQYPGKRTLNVNEFSTSHGVKHLLEITNDETGELVSVDMK